MAATKRVLVTTASKHGATAQIGFAIADELRAGGLIVDVSPVAQVRDLSRFDAVVIGSAVYMGRWMSGARRLVADHEAQLLTKPVWLFSSGPLGDATEPEDEAQAAAAMTAQTGARDHAVFAGRLSRGDLRLGERAVAAMVRAPYGDYRNWARIRGWAQGIAGELSDAPVTERRVPMRPLR
jgi:menaquinone-dependent protoporphyrinogen oxidase